VGGIRQGLAEFRIGDGRELGHLQADLHAEVEREATDGGFGDVLRMQIKVELEPQQRSLLGDYTPDNVLLVLTPACDLQRGAAPRILLLVGTIKPLTAKDWTYHDDAQTSAILQQLLT